MTGATLFGWTFPTWNRALAWAAEANIELPSFSTGDPYGRYAAIQQAWLDHGGPQAGPTSAFEFPHRPINRKVHASPAKPLRQHDLPLVARNTGAQSAASFKGTARDTETQAMAIIYSEGFESKQERSVTITQPIFRPWWRRLLGLKPAGTAYVSFRFAFSDGQWHQAEAAVEYPAGIDSVKLQIACRLDGDPVYIGHNPSIGAAEA